MKAVDPRNKKKEEEEEEEDGEMDTFYNPSQNLETCAIHLNN